MVESFFLIIPMGLESLAIDELTEKVVLLNEQLGQNYSLEILSTHKGGVLIQCPRELGFALNLWLKIPTRILLRLTEFRCRDFPKLYNKIKKVDWHNYLRKGPVEFSVSTVESRLKMKEKIAESAFFALKDYEKHQVFRKSFLEAPQTIFIRIANDTVTVSIDTSGEPLFKRGYKKFSVEAPIRENLAAALVWPLVSRFSEGEIIDMMAGSGTLGFEALSFYTAVKTRNFAFQNFPSFGATVAPALKKPLKKCEWAAKFFELDSKSFHALQKNKQSFRQLVSVSMESFNQNIFEARVGGHWLMNPPYNERLDTDPQSLLNKIREFFKTQNPESFCLVWPGEKAPNVGFKWNNSLKTYNGGLSVTLNFWCANKTESP